MVLERLNIIEVRSFSGGKSIVGVKLQFDIGAGVSGSVESQSVVVVLNDCDVVHFVGRKSCVGPLVDWNGDIVE